jgi:hypothetical protein
MATLTKTESLVLARATENPLGRVCVSSTWSSSCKRSYGRREIAAAGGLVAKGLLTYVKTDRYQHTGYAGSVTHCTDHILQLVTPTKKD